MSINEWAVKREVAKRYDTTAFIYDNRYASDQNEKIKAFMEHVKLSDYDLILDVGCGTGLLFEHVPDKAEVVGVDLSKGVLFEARRKKEKMDNVDLILADADNMPLRNNTFSRVIALTLIQNTPSPPKTLCEMMRVAEHDAILVVSGLKKRFPLDVFTKMLDLAGLRVTSLENESLECHVAICESISSKPRH